MNWTLYFCHFETCFAVCKKSTWNCTNSDISWYWKIRDPLYIRKRENVLFKKKELKKDHPSVMNPNTFFFFNLNIHSKLEHVAGLFLGQYWPPGTRLGVWALSLPQQHASFELYFCAHSIFTFKVWLYLKSIWCKMKFFKAEKYWTEYTDVLKLRNTAKSTLEFLKQTPPNVLAHTWNQRWERLRQESHRFKPLLDILAT